ncbi:hypothetical protein Ais01nite_52030 [Asanoa ishikariensis]|uniref:Uncharacterized protein n=1 Tax=Asanoa ishikariensis TaxID=137265 RepID=A0A1H3RK79_9ACTN|nr:hypothetical protein [Asanoa ishikariensis]GIF67168.1 hypothetical protein Ais01nite_52030 [Asanoa ishikariensis]SDZ25641.1 hypothetical protein SAMN05421684_3875 [Asanoa ishikariensis]
MTTPPQRGSTEQTESIETTDPSTGSDSDSGVQPPGDYQARHRWPSPWWLVVAVLFLVLLGVRIALVQNGWLFGAGG